MDRIDPERRSANMSAIRSRDTKPEMIVRRLVHYMGYRYRLHRKDLPGKPDLVFAGRRKVILVHGCFWHQHPDQECTDARSPRSNQAYWRPKLEGNVRRDSANRQKLRESSWDILVVWECEVKDRDALAVRVQAFLDC